MTLPGQQPAGPVRETHEEASDGDGPWTFVKSKSGRRGGKNRQPTTTTMTTAVPPTSRPEPPTAASLGLTRHQIEAHHRQMQSQWRSQPSFDRLVAVLRSNAATHTPVTRAICLGNGSFDPDDGVYDKIRRAHLQTDAFLAMVDTLSMVDFLSSNQLPLHSSLLSSTRAAVANVLCDRHQASFRVAPSHASSRSRHTPSPTSPSSAASATPSSAAPPAST